MILNFSEHKYVCSLLWFVSRIVPTWSEDKFINNDSIYCSSQLFFFSVLSSYKWNYMFSPNFFSRRFLIFFKFCIQIFVGKGVEVVRMSAVPMTEDLARFSRAGVNRQLWMSYVGAGNSPQVLWPSRMTSLPLDLWAVSPAQAHDFLIMPELLE